MRELFAYYRVRRSDAPALQAAVAAFQTQLIARYPFLRTRLLRRADEANGEQTWMENYATDSLLAPSGVSEAMQAEIECCAVALAQWIRGTRHIEVFLDCAAKQD